jgi:hypothetical protein
MSFLIGLATQLIEKLMVWLGSLIYRNIEVEKEINADNKKADQNSKKVDEAKTPEEKRRASEDLLNGQ